MSGPLHVEGAISIGGWEACGQPLADHLRLGVGLRARSVGKHERDLRGALFQAYQFFIEVNDFLGHDGGERVVQIRAMHAKIGRAEQALRHGQLSHHFSRIPLAV